MKKLFTFILILSTIIINAQNALDKRFIMVAEWDDNILLNDSMWRVNALFSEDQLNGGYLPTQIQVGYLALDATGRRYRVKNIVDATFSTATLDLVEEADLNMPPIGVGIVYVKNLTDIIHSVVHSNTQISPSLMSKIFIHNMVKIDEVALVSSDYTRLLQDSIVVYYRNNEELGRDTIRLDIVSDLASLSDVDITGVADKSILYYDLTSQKWRDTTSNVYISGSGSANRIPIYNGNTSITSNSNLTFDGTIFNANSAAVFNDAGAAVDFRVESDNDANKLFVSGSTDRVGIGINSPTNTLDIDGTLRIRNLNSVTSTGILGVDANGVAERITIGTGLNLTNDVLTATGTLSGSGTTGELTYFSGTTELTSSPRMKFENDGGLVLKNAAEPVSSTFVASQDFTTNTNWTEGTGWIITGGLATATAATGALTYTPTVTITSGRAYLVTVTQSGYSAGTVTIALGNVTSALPQYNASWAVLLRPTASTGGFRFTTSTYTGSLDNVSINEITQGTVLQAFETSTSGTNNMSIVAPNSSTLAIGGGGIYNTAINNLFLGVNAGQNNTSATNNLFLGTNAGQNNTTGGSNIFIGANVGLNNTTGNSNLFIGLNAGLSNTIGGSNAFIGADAGRSNTTGGSNMFIGLSAGRTNISGNSNLFIGASAGFSNTIGGSNSFIGGTAGFSNTEGNENTFVGINSGRSNTTAGINTFVGSNSGRFNTTGNQNTFIGSSAGLSNTTGVSNTFVGTYAGINNTTGGSNIFLGLYTGQNNTSGNNNVFIGNLVGASNTTGSSNVFLGYDAGRRINAGGNLTISNTSIMIGDDTRALADNSSNEIVIGSGGRGNGNNTVTIGNSSITAHYLSGTGALRIPIGTTAQRPTAVQGILRYNSSNNNTEFHTGTAWEYPLKSATESGLGTANQVFFADANGRASGSSSLTFSNNQVNSLYFNGVSGYSLTASGGYTQSTCDHVRINNGVSLTTGTGAIEITLPATFFSTVRAHGLTFDMEIAAYNNASLRRKYTISVSYQQGVTPSGVVTSFDDNNSSDINYRFGYDASNNLKIYIGELTTNWGIRNLKIYNASLYTLFFSQLTPNTLCDGWQATMNTTSFLNATSPVPIQTVFNRLDKSMAQVGTRAAFWQTFGLYLGSLSATATTGAYEFTLTKTAEMTGSVRITFQFSHRIRTNESTDYIVSADINFSTLVWSNAKIDFIGGTPTDSRYNVRLGNDGTNMKIWIGELTSSSNSFSPIIISNIIITQFDVNSVNNALFTALTNRANWSTTIQSTAFGTVNQTLLVNSANSIPFSSIARHAYSPNFVYDNTNTRLGIGTSTPAYSLDITSTNAIKLPTGTTAQRPTVAQGLLRYNTNTMELDVHDGTNWRRVIDIADTNASTGDVVSFTGTAYAAVSQRRGLTTLTTDASGDITLSITMPDATYSAVAIPDGQTFYVITAHTKTTSSVKFRIYDSTGNIVPSGTSISINYNITDY